MRIFGFSIGSTQLRHSVAELRADRIVRRLPACRAFSLVEMVMVLTIISIAAAITVPRFSRAVARRQADSAAQRLTQDLALARHHARVSSSDIKVEFKTSPGYQVVGLPDPNNPNANYTVNMQAAPYHVSQWEVDFEGFGDVTFNMYERPDRSGEIVLHVGSEVRTIAINGENGRTLIFDGDGPVSSNAFELSVDLIK